MQKAPMHDRVLLWILSRRILDRFDSNTLYNLRQANNYVECKTSIGEAYHHDISLSPLAMGFYERLGEQPALALHESRTYQCSTWRKSK